METDLPKYSRRPARTLRLKAFLCLGLCACLGTLSANAAAPQSADAKLVERARADRSSRTGQQLIIKADDIDRLAQRHDLVVIDRHEGPDGTVWLVEAPTTHKTSAVLELLFADAAVASASTVSLASLPAVELSGASQDGQLLADQISAELSPELQAAGTHSDPCLDLIEVPVWVGYARQRAAQQISLDLANAIDQYHCGRGITVAVIDTALDLEHPLLQDAVVVGHNFLDDQPGFAAAMISPLDTKTRAIVEGGQEAVLQGMGTVQLMDSAALIMGTLDAEALADFDSKGAYYGHATMVAGLVRLTAPGANIMPLVAFDENGVGHPFDIVRAIDYAVANGADVINMSFSIDDASAELLAAVENAREHGVMTLAAAGNDGQSGYIFPAAYAATIGVAATDFDDQLTAFSNYGLVNADMTAPGVGLITAFPGGLYASGWGTSFATPLAAGSMALIHDYYRKHNRATHKKLRTDLLLGTDFFAYLWDYILASGRLDTAGAVIEARYY